MGALFRVQTPNSDASSDFDVLSVLVPAARYFLYGGPQHVCLYYYGAFQGPTAVLVDELLACPVPEVTDTVWDRVGGIVDRAHVDQGC